MQKLGFHLDMIISREDEIKQYLLEHIGEPFLGYKQETIIDFIPTAIKAVKIYGVVEDLYKQSEAVKNLNKEDWEKHRGGIKWSQTGRADDIKREGDGIAKQLFDALHLEYLGIKVEGKPLIDAMKNAPIVKDVSNNYSVERNYPESNNFLAQFALVRKTQN